MSTDGADTSAGTTRERLLAAAVDHVARHGVSGQSLRTIARAIGTSHRMLIYHFGSKDELLVQIVRTVEARQREVFARLCAEPDLTATDLMQRMAQHLMDPALEPLERLFFELYGQALQGRPHTASLLEGIVDSWIEPMSEIGRRQGLSPAQARAEARLMVAVARGLLLDYLATGDRAGATEALERFVSLVRADQEASPNHPSI